MTLLQICQDAAVEVSIAAPGTIVNNSADDATKLLRYATKVGRRLMKKIAWQVLRKEQTFTGIAGSTQAAILPADFDRFLAECFWDRTNIRLITGPISAVQWQGMKAGGYSGDPKFIYRGGSILILPVLSGGESLAFEYISNKWCQTSGAVAQTNWAADTDTGILDEELLTLGVAYEYATGEGMPNQSFAQAFEEHLSLLLGNEQAEAGIMTAGDIFGNGRHFGGAPTANSGAII